MRTSKLLSLWLIAVSWSVGTRAQERVSPPRSAAGVLILAHGGNKRWNSEIDEVRTAVERVYRAEVALGMASKRTIQQAVERLEARGVEEIVAVPLFVSSYSPVMTSTEYLLGKRQEAPPELALFARMSHGAGHHGAHDGLATAGDAADATRPVRSHVRIRVAAALDDHPIAADILADRAAAISRDPSREVVVLVAHGPVSDDDNLRWLAGMRRLADRMHARMPFTRIDGLTVRDDAEAPVKAAAAAELRATVSRALTEGHRVLLVPLLVSYGGIEKGIRERLAGLDFTMSPQALLPDARISEWVLATVRSTDASTQTKESTP